MSLRSESTIRVQSIVNLNIYFKKSTRNTISHRLRDID
jgi:hypothetical protein